MTPFSVVHRALLVELQDDGRRIAYGHEQRAYVYDAPPRPAADDGGVGHLPEDGPEDEPQQDGRHDAAEAVGQVAEVGALHAQKHLQRGGV